MKFVPIVGSPLPPADADEDNSAFFAGTVYGQSFGSRVLAVTLTSRRGSVRTETDVIFNSNEDWGSYRGAHRSGMPDFHRVALHEFGHALGLGHPDESGQSVIAIMNSLISGVDSLRADDIAGARSLYDAGPPYLTSTASPNLVNLSTRAFVGTGGNVMIGGFIIQGSQPATVILRAIGHSLAARGVSDPLNDPVLELRNAAGTLVAENDDWITGDDAETIASYHLDPSNSIESALLRTLLPGNYTVLVRAFDAGDGNLSGTGLVELYDLHSTNGRASNISTRGQVMPDSAMIAGYIIGSGPRKDIIVRGLGPSLAASGISSALADPTLELVDGSGNLLGSNDNWESDANAARVRAAGLAPTQPVEAALFASLNPGSYTAILRGVNSASGIGLVEVYDLSAAPN